MVAIAKIIILASGPITAPFPNRLDKNRHSKNLLGLGQIMIGSMTEFPHRYPKVIQGRNLSKEESNGSPVRALLGKFRSCRIVRNSFNQIRRGLGLRFELLTSNRKHVGHNPKRSQQTLCIKACGRC